MKKFWHDNKKDIFFVFICLVFWRIFLFASQLLGLYLLPLRAGFLGPIPWANFDGVHYLAIAENGYTEYKEAFFPLFPMVIKVLAGLLDKNFVLSGFLVTHIAFFVALLLFWKLVRIDISKNIAIWSIMFLLAFPTSFFFGSIYTESLFLMLVLGSFYAARRKLWILVGVLGALASATKFIGIFLFPVIIFEYFYQTRVQEQPLIKRIILFFQKAWGVFLIPSGLLVFMYYLNSFSGDSLAFIYRQSAFGANRSGEQIILLPQVIFRYIKIFLTVPLTNYDFWIAILEFFMFIFVLGLLIFGWGKIRKSYILFSFLVVIIPTLTGTLSSMPRYILAAFPIFIILGCLENKFIKYLLLSISLVLLTVLSLIFFRGYFVA